MSVRINKQKVRIRLAELGLNQRELAKKLNKPESTVSAWLSGRHNPSMKILKKLSEVLNIDSISDLIEDTDEDEVSEKRRS